LARKKLPIGISEFAELREKNCVYVDKTRHIYSLLTDNSRTFLSRPRRFGKSLLASTLAAALQGKKELFEGLWITNSDYAWTPVGVIKLDFSELSTESIGEFKESFLDSLIDIGESEGITLKESSNINVIFRHLISTLQVLL